MASYKGITDIWTINPYASDLYSSGFSGNGITPPPPQDTFLEDENNVMITINSNNGEGILVI